ncbi:TPA: hypothetical protein ACQTZL_002108 [Pseudomonas aeruginosa]|uniref:hypothetical protein n=1 Tax=Pseudomonas aeruginosa TaxID=287 RepID=UPI000F71A6A5|nr:hypothetical protein [Pseudomonas aeruginosa]VEF59332.1 Uncharacterised protein [Pseudomonas aeruginosa]HBN8952300.1 hypothetical protein [Pseudomonas aeruginosa]HBN9443941.1 hypothetical protein [Pseudomonas aeruginosa]HDV4169682.1 hypothetical protein [Pseudomonas aeruginosa]
MAWYLSFIDPGNAGGSVSIPESPPVVLQPIVYECPRCSAHFDSVQARRDHFFTAHPYRKPELLLCGQLLGNSGTVINVPVQATDWLLGSCHSVSLNGQTMAPEELFQRLAECRQGFHVLELGNQDTTERLDLRFCIPELAELQRLEDIFNTLFLDNELSVDDVRRFAEACKSLKTANEYLEGVCQYLYGVLAKDQRGGTQLSHAHYKERFNRALEALRYVDRPLARTMRGIINFSFNSFVQVTSQADAPALAAAASLFAGWAGKPVKGCAGVPQEAQARLPVDHATDRLLSWMALPDKRQEGELDELQQVSASSIWTAEDRTKALVLWLEWGRTYRSTDELRRMARRLLNDSVFAGYAEQVLERINQ